MVVENLSSLRKFISNYVWGGRGSLELHNTSTLQMTNLFQCPKKTKPWTTFLFLFQLVYVIVVK